MELTVADIEELRRLEEAMWRTETRAGRQWMELHLADGFTEFGRSGRAYERDEILDMPIGTIDARSSIWRRSAGGWRLEFHQGTPTTG